MRKVKWMLVMLMITLVVSMLHYTLPQRDIVRITDAYEKRENFENRGFSRYFYASSDSGTGGGAVRDVRYIDAVYVNGKVIVYRNEDTGFFGWPPYFKWNSSDVNAEAKNLQSNIDAPRWVSVLHYGWRIPALTIYPNAISIKPVSGPDVTFFPWFNTIFLIIMGLFALGLFRLFQRFKQRRIDPVLEDMETAWEDASAKTSGGIKGLWSKLTNRGK